MLTLFTRWTQVERNIEELRVVVGCTFVQNLDRPGLISPIGSQMRNRGQLYPRMCFSLFHELPNTGNIHQGKLYVNSLARLLANRITNLLSGGGYRNYIYLVDERPPFIAWGNVCSQEFYLHVMWPKSCHVMVSGVCPPFSYSFPKASKLFFRKNTAMIVDPQHHLQKKKHEGRLMALSMINWGSCFLHDINKKRQGPWGTIQ